MSLRLRKAAKALRARFGVALGVQPAKSGEKCTELVLDLPEERQVLCSERAHVREGEKLLCREHMKRAHKPRRA